MKNNLTATHTSASYTTFTKLLDPGDMSLFRCRYTENDRMLVLSGIDQEIGFVNPPYGATGNLAAGQTIVCTASNLVADAAGYAGVCTGHVVYAKSGDVRTVLSRGPETTFAYTHPGYETELVWLWETNRYALVKAAATEGGTFEFPGKAANNLYPLGASLTLTAVPAEGYSFIRWKGVDASLASSPQITVEVTAPATYTAIFGNPLPPVFVKAGATGDADGTTWRDAFPTIGAGVAAAIAQGGGEVRVAGGVYPVTAAIAITGANAVSVLGGYPGLDEGETDADRDPDLHQVVITADTGTQVSTWNHFAPSADGMSYTATNTPLKIVENGRVNLPDAYLAGEYDSFYPKRANNNTASAFNASGAAPFLLDGVWFVARGPVFTVATTCTSFVARDCRIVGCNGMVYTTSAAQTSTYPRRFENCQFLHLSGKHFQPKGIAEFDNCVFRGNYITGDSTTFYLWAGGPTYYRGCEFSRHARFVAANGTTASRASNGNVFSDEQSSGGVFSGCVFTNNLTSAKNEIGSTLLSVNTARFAHCLFENNWTLVTPASGRSYTALFPSNVSGGLTTVEDCHFARNRLSAPVNDVEGSFYLALVGGANGDAGTFLNSTFVSNRVEWADNGKSTVVASRGIFVSGGNGQRAIAHCAFVGPGDDVYDVVQYGSSHSYATRVHNCVFVRDGEQRNPFYVGTPSKFSVRDCSIAGFTLVPDNLDIDGLEIDPVPLETVDADGLPTLRPAARMPSARTTYDIATNGTSSTASYFRFRAPGATTWTLYLTSGAVGNDWKKLSTATPLPIRDALGAVRPFGSFTRGPVQSLSAAAEAGHTLVLRADPYNAATFSPSHVQIVAPGATSASAAFTALDGATFNGWYANGVLLSASATLPPMALSEDTVVEARFTPADVTLTYDLGPCGTFTQGGASTIAVTATPDAPFPETPAFAESDDWHFESWSPALPASVPWTNVTFTATYVPKALRVIRVVPEGEVPAGSDGSGSSWANARSDLADAYADAGRYRGEVWLKAGTYEPAGSMLPRSNVAIRGGFVGDETSADQADPVANPTVIDGKSAVSAFLYSGQATNCVVQGVTITRFVNTAIRLTGASTLELRDCTISSCGPSSSSATINARVVYVAGRLLAENCTFQANARNLSIYDPATAFAGATNIIRNCLFRGNRFTDMSGAPCQGAALYYSTTLPLVLENCDFIGNYSQHYDSAPAIRYASSGNSLVTDCRFLGNNVGSTARAPIDIRGGAHEFARCTFETNLTSTTGAYHYPTISAVFYQAGGRLLVRDSLFRGNTNNAPSTKAYADNQGNASVLAAPGAVTATFVNCTMEKNRSSTSAAAGSAGTIRGDNARIALVHCAVRDNAIGTGAAYTGEFSFGGGGSASTFSLVNSLVQPMEGVAVFKAPASFHPCVANSVIMGVDLADFAPTNSSYLVNASADAIRYERGYRVQAPVPEMAVAAPSFAHAHRGTPVWRASNDLFYFFDPTPGVAKPWRLVTDKSTSYTEEAARTTPGLSRALPPVPDAFGAPRGPRSAYPGPVNPRDAGTTVILR
ncbi:MAG: right-handed parallel beta-helix repeat-containing protein [Fastidiosipilaceae bacterium]